ncbi:hypothetical protein EM59_016435 [Vibrio parahaemolyticus]|uniref:hypothetical protein n=1 Tax=Vibrio parahaemolyticus TaxID=670 RepID=UPI0004D3E3E9|nr:hypothetical protein [Vibrio parahaemolyticus]EGQ7650917.1 hypothetical protein [Vibrio parahaemolyticus]EGQ9979469.1 hypothetical protein [Vibrio parahaemolyticus]EJG1824799.1 hypothetical protein [Vibrio parahaemolyticus]ELB2744108.1 hypothetical protein [Vibrio parahaemolyticus]ELC9528607.1 hypothetical protein [Vibrio parahaemolyticus]
MSTKTTAGRKRSCQHEEIIRLKKENPYIPANAIIQELSLPIKKAMVNRIIQQAKNEGLL